MEAIEHPPILTLPGIPDHVTYTWLVMLLLTGVAFAASRRPALVPRGLQNVMEVVLEQFLALIDDVIGPAGRRYLPLIATLGLFILTGNLISLVPGVAGPTANLNTTAACALIVFVAYHWIGARTQGLGAYLKHFMGPVPALAPLMVPIELISHLARPLSLSLRLFGNMTGGHILLAIIFFLMGLDGLLGWALSGSAAGVVVGGVGTLIMIVFTVGFLFPLKILVSFLQAFIFVMLTMLYIAGAIEHGEGHSEHRSPHHSQGTTQERRVVVRRSLSLATLAVLGVPGVALAQQPAPAAAWVGPFGVLVAGLAMAFAAGLCALGQGRAIAAAVEAMARQPGAAARIQTAMIIGLALIESLAIYVLVVAMILLFVQPIR